MTDSIEREKASERKLVVMMVVGLLGIVGLGVAYVIDQHFDFATPAPTIADAPPVADLPDPEIAEEPPATVETEIESAPDPVDPEPEPPEVAEPETPPEGEVLELTSPTPAPVLVAPVEVAPPVPEVAQPERAESEKPDKTPVAPVKAEPELPPPPAAPATETAPGPETTAKPASPAREQTPPKKPTPPPPEAQVTHDEVTQQLIETAYDAPSSSARLRALRSLMGRRCAQLPDLFAATVANQDLAMTPVAGWALDQCPLLADRKAGFAIARQGLEHSSSDIRQRALTALSRFGSGWDFSGDLEGLLRREPDEAVQRKALSTAANMLRHGERRYTVAYAAALQASATATRRTALNRLKEWKLSKYAPQVAFVAREDSDANVRKQAIGLLQAWKAPEAFDALKAWVFSRDPARKKAAVDQLERHHVADRRAMGLLHALRHDPDKRLANRARRILERRERSRRSPRR